MTKKLLVVAKIDGRGVPEAALYRVRGGQGSGASSHGQEPPKPGDTRWHVMPQPHGTRWHVMPLPNGTRWNVMIQPGG
jgi:hypothetical protein